MTGSIPLRISLQNEWANDVPLKFLWTISFFPRGAAAASLFAANTMSDIGANISSILARYEGPNKWPVVSGLFDYQSDPNSYYGYMFAQNVALPNDAYNVSNSSLDNVGGFLPGYISGDRNGYGASNGLSITFLETNLDIIDNFIRPWIIAASYKGLIEDGKEDIKCNIMVNYYTRAKPGQGGLPVFQHRKALIFEDAIPHQVSGDELNYSDISFAEVSKTVGFAFSRYYTIPVV